MDAPCVSGCEDPQTQNMLEELLYTQAIWPTNSLGSLTSNAIVEM